MTREEIEKFSGVEPYCFETDREEEWYKIGCIDGLNAADAEPNLENLWHDANENPKENSVILVQWNIKGNSGYEFYYADSINWDRFVELYGVSIWAYIDDLLPKQFRKSEQPKGGEK